MNDKQTITDLFSESVTDSNGLIKIPGSIVHVPNPAHREAIKKGLIKKCGHRYVLTISGYNAA